MLAAIELGTVIWIVMAISIPASIYALASLGKALSQIGKGQFAMDGEVAPPRRAPMPPISDAVRKEEIRQMVQARSDRRVARGEDALDVDAEIALLEETDTAATPDLRRDLALREEVRQLVLARNERRMRRGEEPLEVEEEIDRQLRDLA